jgi:hypothetical protein
MNSNLPVIVVVRSDFVVLVELGKVSVNGGRVSTEGFESVKVGNVSTDG